MLWYITGRKLGSDNSTVDEIVRKKQEIIQELLENTKRRLRHGDNRDQNLNKKPWK